MPHRMLTGLRVVELATEIAGPYCGKLLVDAGADVVKAEPLDGDPLRRWSASGRDLSADDGVLFAYLNAGKRSVVTTGRGELDELLSGAHLLVESGQLPRPAIDDLRTLLAAEDPRFVHFIEARSRLFRTAMMIA